MTTNTTSQTSKLTLTAMFAAITCIATMLIKIPTPATQGYIHFGDAFVILAGVFPGGAYGLLAAGIGSALADIFSGYVAFAPVTFIVKALCALVVTLSFRLLASRISKNYVRLLIGGIFSALVVAGGYFVYEIFIYGPAAFTEIPMNLVQGGSGIVISLILFPILSQIPELKKYLGVGKKL